MTTSDMEAPHRSNSNGRKATRRASGLIPAIRQLHLSLGLLSLAVSALGCIEPYVPAPGIKQFQELGVVAVAGVRVNAAAGNLLLDRTDLVLDTRLGPWSLSATYNSISREWLWNHDIRFDGIELLDETGAVYPVDGLSPGDRIRGSRWILIDSQTIRTLGGRVYEFAPNGQLAAVRWASSPYPRLGFSHVVVGGNPVVSEIRQYTDASTSSPVYWFSSDLSDGRLTGAVDRANRATSYGYDSTGRLDRAQDGLDVAKAWPGFRYEYDADLRLSAVTNSEGERVEIDYDSEGRAIQVTQVGASLASWTFSYSAPPLRPLRKITSLSDPLGAVRTYSFDGKGRLRSFLNEHTEETTYFWVKRRLTRRILPSGAQTVWSYPAPNRIVTTLPSGNVVEALYALDGVDRDIPSELPVLSVTDSIGSVETRSYNAQGRLASISNGESETTYFEYDSAQNLVSRDSPSTGLAFFGSFGDHGHPTYVSRGLVSQAFSYDAVGDMTYGMSLDNPLMPGRPGIQSREFDEDRNVRRLTMADESSAADVWISYRSDGRPLTIQRPHGGDTEHQHDPIGRLMLRREKVDGVWKTTTFEHDLAGNLTAMEQPNGTRLTLEVSAGDRVSRIALSRSGIEEKALDLSYQDGLVTQRLDSTYGTPEIFQYDSAGRIATHVFAQGESELLSYDERSRLVGRQLVAADFSPVGSVGYSFDLANRAIDLSLDGASEVAWAYTGGLLSSTSYGNGLSRSFFYGTLVAGLLESTDTISPTLGVVASSSYGYSAANGQSEVSVDTCTDVPTLACTFEEYTLRPIDQTGALAGPRLHKASLEYWGSDTPDQAVDRDYQYDHLHNLRSDDASKNPGVEWQYNAERNRLLASADHTYSYDDAGFVTTRDGVPIAWDAMGLIASIGPASFVWDLAARPVSADNGVSEVRYLFGGMVRADASGIPIELELGKLSVRLATGEKRYRHLDFRGNVKFVTDEGGSPVLHYGYSGYKVEVVFGNDSDRRSFVEGTELGDDLYVLGVRVYDGSAGRFLSPDPIFQIVNQYAYAEGNPIWLSDPDGMDVKSQEQVDQEGWETLRGASGAGAVGALVTGQLLVALFLLGIALIAHGQARGGDAAIIPGFSEPVGFCSPERIAEIPDLSWLLLFLIPVQILLAVFLVRSKHPLGREMRGLRAGPVEALLHAGVGSWKRRLERRAVCEDS